jgi:hypothetical protein
MAPEAGDVRGAGRKTVVLPSGAYVEIRRLVRRDLMRLNMLPFPLSGGEQELRQRIRAGEASPEEVRQFAEWMDANNAEVLKAACVVPPIWFGEIADMPAGAAHYSDLTDADMDCLLRAIAELAGWITPEEAAEAAPFPGRPAGGGTGPAGEAISEAPA